MGVLKSLGIEVHATHDGSEVLVVVGKGPEQVAEKFAPILRSVRCVFASQSHVEVVSATKPDLHHLDLGGGKGARRIEFE